MKKALPKTPDLSGWNYRIFRYKKKLKGYPDWEEFGIHEAYYDKNGKVTGWTQEPIIVGDSINELYYELVRIKKDMDRMPEVLDYDESDN